MPSKDYNLGALLLGSYAIKSSALLLSLVFVLVAPNLMGEGYADYIFYTRVVALLALLLTYGSAGTISRFARELDDEGICSLVGRAIRTKYFITAIIVIPVTTYSVLVGDGIFILLLLLALLKAVFDAIMLLVYALEHYRERLYFQFVHVVGRLVLLPLFLLSQTAYIFFTEILGYLPSLRTFFRRFKQPQVLAIALGKSRRPPVDIPLALLTRVEWHTYASNLLYYLLPIFPVLIFNHQEEGSLRELTIAYVLAVNVVYALASAINDIALPRLVRSRHDRRHLALFLLLCIGIAAITAICVPLLFDLIKPWLIGFYGLNTLESFQSFLIFSIALIVLNGIRQIMFVRDQSATFSLLLLLAYLYMFIQLGSGVSLVDILTPVSLSLMALSISLTLATLATTPGK